MRKIIQIAAIFLTLFFSNDFSFGQERSATDEDSVLKKALYAKYKKEVRSYDKKDFDDLFFEFFQKQNSNKIVLTKEEFYTYTIKIACYSEKLGLLYKSQKQESIKAKESWFNKKYSDYLKTKK